MLAVAAPQPDRVLRTVRGVSVGGVAGLTAVAGHSLAMPGETPGVGTFVFLLAVCAVIGATVTALPRVNGTGALLAILGTSQLVGHLAMSVGTTHGLHLPSATMLAAHALAIAGGALLVAAADRATRRALGLLHRLLRAEFLPPLPAARPWTPIVSDEPLIARLAAANRHVRRGPPAAFAPVSH
ncbi:hypothetical protein GOARA_021_01040 [Gordonia araii NBRC 100433]|uniref:Uncharacterized protein n=1 Tax=Gordonia araii NBRC 100433 TaxID=1073574 RepID=G7GZ42_9ACTN|nr:hypothetical protein [Gordonia araii]NNG97074.1 hypothetical protein [Gordonia araii NBRC 100433]GAB08867.1 hypothetical protein GOARA_021_01040 [Gordonia araii NBRC 100433]